MTLLQRVATPHAAVAGAQDRFGRTKRKLRVSLTDRCNFRCPYCMPETPAFMDRADRLSRPQLGRLLRLFVTELGITRLRLTGGEPLLRRDLASVIAESGALRTHGLERISLTTNGALLAGRVGELKHAGLDDLNISLDALTPGVFSKLSGGRDVEPVLDGIRAARDAGLPFKINTVVVRDINEGEILPLARWAMAEGISLRFIEFMPLDGRGTWSRARVVTQAEILATLQAQFAVAALPRTEDPAAYFSIEGTVAGRTDVGVIATVSNPFCASCDRLRITADGSLYTCLFSKRGISLRDHMRAGADDTALAHVIREAIWNKDAGYALQPGYVERPIAMNSLGG